METNPVGKTVPEIEIDLINVLTGCTVNLVEIMRPNTDLVAWRFYPDFVIRHVQAVQNDAGCVSVFIGPAENEDLLEFLNVRRIWDRPASGGGRVLEVEADGITGWIYYR